MNYAESVKFLVAMIIMMNPLGSLSFYLQLTSHYSEVEQRQTALKCGLTIAIIMFVTIWAGSELLDLLGITIASFRFAGGVILLLTGLSMLQSKESPISHTPEDDIAATERSSVAIVPLAMPFIIGPGAISTMVIATSDFSGLTNKLWLSFLAGGLALGMLIVLYFGSKIGKMVGESVMKVITRIMGMIIMAIAAGMLASGISGLFPVLA